jgi:phosphatidyl-myo-inositol dimannoside synthase
MKILLFAASFPPPSAGGSIEYIFNIVSYLPSNSVVIHTGNTDPVKAEKLDKSFPQRIIRSFFIIHVEAVLKRNILARKLTSLREYLLWPIVGLWLINREHPDIIHIGEHNFAGIAALLAQRMMGIPYIFYTYAEEIPILSKRRLHNRIFLTFVRNAKAVITVSDYTRELLAKVGVSRDRIIKILPAVSGRKRFATTSNQIEAVRHKYELENFRVLLTVGALVDRKGHSTVISALPDISRTFPDLKYVIVGTGPNELKLKREVEEAGLNKQVIFTGLVDDMELSCLYEICDIFIMPHRQLETTLDTEGCPTVFLEASAHGKPVIGGNAGGVADAIIDGRTGLIIDGKVALNVVNAVRQLLENPNLANELGRAGRDYVSHLTPEANARKIWEVSRDLIHNNRSHRSWE